MKILVTAGPTREPLDPVRFLSNRSSGKMGYALAARAAGRGHDVVLISGPVSLAAPEGVSLVAVTTAADMLRAVQAHLDWCEVLVMAAAVADWRPVTCSETKLKKASMPPQVALERTVDILATMAPLKAHRVFAGFAAETDDVIEEARRKVEAKGLDLIVANDVSDPDAGFAVDTNRVTLVYADGTAEPWPIMSKVDVAERVIAVLETLPGRALSPTRQPRVDGMVDTDHVGLEE